MRKVFILVLIVGLGTLQACTSFDTKLINDPEVLAISIKENNEPPIDLKQQTAISFGPSPEIMNNTDYTKMRKTVYDKLIKAQASLPEGLRFCIYESYRSLALQDKLFKERYQVVKRIHLDWDHEQIFKETTKLVSPVVNLDGSKNIPPHSTGAAIDIYLIDAQGNPVDMGIHPKDWMSDLDGSLSQTDSQRISYEAEKNRQIMSDALEGVGFINYPTEYWHWSYGDKYWAYHTRHKYAKYGPVKW
jgi:D-alanyl-D-alanine dipeptidase